MITKERIHAMLGYIGQEYMAGDEYVCRHHSQPDMLCPDLYESDKRFWSASCLAKQQDASNACHYRGCAAGNAVRAKHGLPPLAPRETVIGRGECITERGARQSAGLGTCVECGGRIYLARGFDNCAACRYKVEILNEKDPRKRKHMKDTIKDKRRRLKNRTKKENTGAA